MRGKHALVLMIAVLVLAAIGATAAFAGAGGTPNGGNSATHANRDQTHKSSTDASKDPSNPDGTYRGKSPSKPDQDGIGADHGLDNNDKTGPGTDGNNGCGNDADREDDNNGWCGNKPPNENGPTESPAPEVSPTATSQSGAEVLGQTFTRPAEVAGRNLSRTGVGMIPWAIAAFATSVAGFALRALGTPKR